MTWRAPVIRGTTLLMEAIWTYAVLAFTVAAITDGGEPSFFGAAAVVFLSYGISRGLQNSDFSLGLIRIWGTIFSFLVFYAIVRVDFFGDWRFYDFAWANDIFNHTEATARANVPAVFGVPMMWGFWMRGVLRGQETTTFEDVVSSFGIGVLIVAFVQVFQADVDDVPALVGQIAIPYVAFGLFSIALAHSARAETDRGRPFERTLLAAAGLSIVALALVAGVIALFDAATGWETAQAAGDTALSVGEDVGLVLIWPILRLMDGVFWVLIWLRDLILGPPAPPNLDAQGQEEAATCVEILMEERGLTEAQAVDECTPDRRQLPQWVQTLVRIIIATPFVGLAILITALLFSRFRRVRTPGALKESAYQEGRLASDLSGLLNNLINRFRPNLHLGRDQLDAIRRLYLEMVDDAGSRGVTREPWQTPNEFVPRLDRAYNAPVPGDITHAFDDVRYGGHTPNDQEARRLRDEWDRLRSG